MMISSIWKPRVRAEAVIAIGRIPAISAGPASPLAKRDDEQPFALRPHEEEATRSAGICLRWQKGGQTVIRKAQSFISRRAAAAVDTCSYK